MAIELNNAQQMFDLGREHIRRLKRAIITGVADEFASEVVKESGNRLPVRTAYRPNGFVAGVPLTQDDPDGALARQIEDETHAVEKAVAKVSDPEHVVDLIIGGSE